MRILGGILCWFLPDAVFRRVLSEDAFVQDIGSNVLTSLVLMAAGQAALSLGASMVDIFLYPCAAAAGLFFALFTGWLVWSILRKADLPDNPLIAPFPQVLACHLHIGPVLFSTVFLYGGGQVTENAWLQALALVLVIRALDLEARMIRLLCDLSRFDAYKVTLVLALVYGALFAAGFWLIGQAESVLGTMS